MLPGMDNAISKLMKNLFFILFAFTAVGFADVIIIEDEVIHYQVPDGLLKKPSLKDDFMVYFDSEKKVRLLVQLFRKRKWADWNIRGIKKSKKTFQKFFDTELGGGNGETLDEVVYDEKKYELTLWWTQADGNKLVSRMKLTSFGCVAVHIPYQQSEAEAAEQVLAKVTDSFEIPENLKFVPESMMNDIMSNVGGGLVFIILSLTYLMFSLFKRSQLRQMRLERQMQQIKSVQLQTRTD